MLGRQQQGCARRRDDHDERLPGKVPSLGDALAVAAGDRFSCALTGSGAVSCWGNNEFGQLGDGTNTTRSTPVPVVGLATGVTAIAARGEHACALVDSRVRCWGANNDGQLGDGTMTERPAPVEVAGITGVSAITTGGEHTCAILAGGGAECWGWNVWGQLGDGSTIDRPGPVQVNGLASGIVAISAGGRHTCALMTQGGVKCWGYGEFGQLGNGATADSPVPVDVSGLSGGIASITAGGNLTCALRTASGVLLGIDPTALRLRRGPDRIPAISNDVVAVKAGFYHVCAVKAGGTVTCWGGNDVGQLGNGTIGDSSPPTLVKYADGISDRQRDRRPHFRDRLAPRGWPDRHWPDRAVDPRWLVQAYPRPVRRWTRRPDRHGRASRRAAHAEMPSQLAPSCPGSVPTRSATDDRRVTRTAAATTLTHEC